MTDLHRLRVLEESASPAPWEDRKVHPDYPLPHEPLLYGVVCEARHVETARVWEEADCRLISALRNSAKDLISAAEVMKEALPWLEANLEEMAELEKAGKGSVSNRESMTEVATMILKIRHLEHPE